MTPHQRHMGPHMKWTALRPADPGDPERADNIVQTLRHALEKYKDYRVAVDAGFVPMHPERKPRYYHFASKERRLLARTQFDAAQPTTNGYELEGAMNRVRKKFGRTELRVARGDEIAAGAEGAQTMISVISCCRRR